MKYGCCAEAPFCDCPDGPDALTVSDLGKLRLAGRWGLLRYQAGMRFALAGTFSMRSEDMYDLVKAAGGLAADPDVISRYRTELVFGVDILVAGPGAGDALVETAMKAGLEVLTEEQLVLRLVPSMAGLLATPGSAPF